MRPTTIDIANAAARAVSAKGRPSRKSAVTAPAVPESDLGNGNAGNAPAVSRPCAVKIGNAIGVGQWMTAHDVLGLLSEDGRTRLALMENVPGVKVLASQLRGTDGASAPVVFSGDEKPEHIVFGYPNIAALAHIGISDIFVITVHPNDVQLIQSRMVLGRKFYEIASST
jgi:hypothetical protein